MKKLSLRLLCVLLAVMVVLSLLPMTMAADLRPGSRGSKVKYMQQNLIGLGFLDDAADGSYGSKTKAAVKAFQLEYGLEADGTADDRTQTALANAVVRLQVELKLAGFDPGSADGHFGGNTRSAVKRYQKAHGIQQTGVAGKITRAEIDRHTPGLQVDQKIGKGSHRTQIKYLQQALIGLDFLSGSADGSYGNQTKAAVKAYQKAYGLKVDGSAGMDTLTSLKNTVVTLQSDLGRKGYFSDTCSGVYGSNTTKAVKAYQKAHGLKATGIAGSDTMKKLYGISFHGGSSGGGGTSGEVRKKVQPLYQDGDYRKIYYGWKHQYSTTVHTSGCGGVSTAMALNALLGTDSFDGQNVMQWFADNGAYYGDGTHQKGMIDYAEELGLRGLYCDSRSDVLSHLKKGRMVVALIMDKTDEALFCESRSKGHYILLSGYRESGGEDQVYVNNPLSFKRSGWFDLDDVVNNAKNENEGYTNSYVVIYG